MVDRIRQYKSRIKQWKLDKNIKPDEMKCIVRKRQKRKLLDGDKPELVFQVRGNQVDEAKIDRWMNKHEIPNSMLYAASPAACECATHCSLGRLQELTCQSNPIGRRLLHHLRARLSSTKGFANTSAPDTTNQHSRFPVYH